MSLALNNWALLYIFCLIFSMLGKIQQTTFEIYFLLLPENCILHFMQIVS